MSELIKWFQKREENKALANVQRHLALTASIVEDLENTIKAAVKKDLKIMKTCIERVASAEKEADSIRRKVMDQISSGDLSPIDRNDLMELVKRVDMIADWSRESTRVLNSIPLEHVPETIKQEFIEMVNSVKECTASLQTCVNKMITRPEQVLQAADHVEREEEKVDEIHEKARTLIGTEDIPKAGAAILASQLFEAMEMIADSCEDACDQVRVIMVRK